MRPWDLHQRIEPHRKAIVGDPKGGKGEIALYPCEVFRVRTMPNWVPPPAMKHADKFKVIGDGTYEAELDADEIEEAQKFPGVVHD